MIKNIVFDLGNVILKDTPSIVLEKSKVFEENREEIKSKFFGDWRQLDLGNETLEEHLDNCGIISHIDDKARDLLLNYYRYRPFNDEIIDLMNNLKEHKYNIFILSNNNKEAYEYLRNLPMFSCVDGWIMSCDYHIVKPDRELYVKLFELFDIKPEESFFIDDKEKNIIASKELGMEGFIFNLREQGMEKLIETLKELGVEM